MQVLLFLGMTAILMSTLIGITVKKKVDFQSMIGLFLFGILLSIPFIMVEYLAFHLKYYLVILAFIAIELGIIFTEKKVKYFHDLIHHNVQKLRLLSYLIIGIGFTFSEISFFIFKHHDTAEIVATLPAKTLFAVGMHTLFTSAASLGNAVGEIAETVFASIMRFFSYYLRIALISMSHYMYIFFLEHKFTLLVIPFVILNVYAFFKYKAYLDRKALANA